MGCLCSKQAQQDQNDLETGKASQQPKLNHVELQEDEKIEQARAQQDINQDNSKTDKQDPEPEHQLENNENETRNLELPSNAQQEDTVNKDLEKSGLDKSDSKANTSKAKKKKKVKKTADNYDDEIVIAINEFRQNPSSLIEKFEDLKTYIKWSDKSKKLLLDKKGWPKVAFTRGEEAVNDCIQFITELKPMNPLKSLKGLKIPLPENFEDVPKGHEGPFNELKSKFAGKYSIMGIHFDLKVPDANLALLLMILDDNQFNGIRRNNICNPEYRFIGVSSANLGEKKNFASYFVFAG